MSTESFESVTPAPAIISAPEPVASQEDDLGAVWDKLERDNGADRDNGKFVSPDPEKREADTAVPPAGEGEEVVAEVAPPATADVPLPANWTGMEAAWEKIPAEARADIAAHAQKLHATLSDQGRQLSTQRPVNDVLNEFSYYFDGRVRDDAGNPVTPAAAVKYLFTMQKSMDQNPVATILQIAKEYKAEAQLAAVFSGALTKEQLAQIQAPQGPAGLTPAQVKALVDEVVESKTAEQTISKTLADFAAAKPHYKAVEADLPDFITLARKKLGGTASTDAVLDRAYEMAVYADPTLRASAAAPKPAAAADDSKKADAARRANAVNVTSTSSGKTRTLSEEEELGQVYDKVKAK